MKVISKKNPITLEELSEMAENLFGNLVKAVVDVEQEIMAVDGKLHSDEEAILIESGSKQTSLWGINIYPNNEEDKRVEFDCLINIRPRRGNRSCGVDDPRIKEKIIQIVNSLVKR